MKTLRYFFFTSLATLLMAADCSNDDNEFYNDVFVNVPNLVVIEKMPAYTIGDVLWINTTAFSRYEFEANQSTPLDIYRSSGGAPSFSFTYLLEKKTSGENWEVVNLENRLQNQLGEAVASDFVFAKSNYNPESENYDFRNGIKLTQTGDYRLSFGYNSASVSSVELRSDSFGNNLFLNINSLNTDIDGNGYYSFTVN